MKRFVPYRSCSVRDKDFQRKIYKDCKFTEEPKMRKDYHTHPRVIDGTENFDAFARVALGKKITEICVTEDFRNLEQEVK